jgi:hypothetical protein
MDHAVAVSVVLRAGIARTEIVGSVASKESTHAVIGAVHEINHAVAANVVLVASIVRTEIVRSVASLERLSVMVTVVRLATIGY